MTDLASDSTAARILVSDFDGTMTRHDFYKLAIEKLLPADTPSHWADDHAGTITLLSRTETDMFRPTQISIPTLVRVKEGALDRVGLYLTRDKQTKVAVLVSHGLVPAIQQRVTESFQQNGITAAAWVDVVQNDLEFAAWLFTELQKSFSAIVGVGGGKALDVAKYVAFLARLPYYAVPTSLSNDGFCSPQSSLTVRGHRRSLPAALPHGIIVDTAVCHEAPRLLTLSGIGDLVAKFTAVRDWKLAFHATG